MARRTGRRFTFNGIHSNIQVREFDVNEGRGVPVLMFHSAHELGDELERGWGHDVVRVNFPKPYVFLVKGRSDFGGEALHDVLVEVGSECKVVEDFGFMELLHHFRVCLQDFNLRSKIFGNFLYGLIAREVFENPGDVTSKNVDAAEFLN